MSTYLTLLGRPEVEHDGQRLALPAERRGQMLVALAVRRAWVTRSELAQLLWPGERGERAATNLRKALHFARALPWAAALEVQAGMLRFVVDTDLHDIDAAWREGRLLDALQRCRGLLLDGLDDTSNAAWTDWLDAERAHQSRRWQQLTRARLAQLAPDPDAAAAFARQLLDADPLDEDALVALLAAQRELGALDQQRATYRSFAVRLDEELGVEPSLRVRQQLTLPVGSEPPQPAAAGFVGRARELDELAARLTSGSCRLLSVTGPGGVGKSSLLKHALRRLAPRFADGALWIALDDLSTNDQVIARIAAECKLTLAAARDPLQIVCEHLNPRAMLLVLDNGEHLSDLARLLERLLDGAPALKVCVTSRVRLGAPGE